MQWYRDLFGRLDSIDVACSIDTMRACSTVFEAQNNNQSQVSAIGIHRTVHLYTDLPQAEVSPF